MRAFILLLFLGLGLCSFGNEEGVRNTLAKAGANKQELEKVLEYYKNDALKYQAACFPNRKYGCALLLCQQIYRCILSGNG